MKYLKKYNENIHNDRLIIINNIKDFLMDLIDEGFKLTFNKITTQFIDTDNISFINGEIDTIKMIFGYYGKRVDDIHRQIINNWFDYVKPNILSLIDYMYSEGYEPKMQIGMYEFTNDLDEYYSKKLGSLSLSIEFVKQ